MEDTIDIVLGILDVILLNKYDKKYTKYITKTINYGIEYVEPIDMILIPKKIYITTNYLAENCKYSEYIKHINNFCSNLICGIQKKYIHKDNNIQIPNVSTMGLMNSSISMFINNVSCRKLADYTSIIINLSNNINIDIIIKFYGNDTIFINNDCISLELK